MSDHVVQASEAFRQGASQMPGWLIPATAADIARLRVLNHAETELARAIDRMVDGPDVCIRKQRRRLMR